jgi:hypothetical protein
MSVGQDDGIEVVNGQLERFPVVQAQLLVALEQAAIDQNMLVTMLQQVLAAGNRARRAKKCHAHGRLLEGTWER